MEGVWGVGGGCEGDCGGIRGAGEDGWDGCSFRFCCDFSVGVGGTLAVGVGDDFTVDVDVGVDVAVRLSFAGVVPVFFLKSDKSLVGLLPIGAVTFFAELPGKFNGSNVFLDGVAAGRGEAILFLPDALAVLGDGGTSGLASRIARHFLRAKENTVGEDADIFWAALYETRG